MIPAQANSVFQAAIALPPLTTLRLPMPDFFECYGTTDAGNHDRYLGSSPTGSRRRAQSECANRKEDWSTGKRDRTRSRLQAHACIGIQSDRKACDRGKTR